MPKIYLSLLFYQHYYNPDHNNCYQCLLCMYVCVCVFVRAHMHVHVSVAMQYWDEAVNPERKTLL